MESFTESIQALICNFFSAIHKLTPHIFKGTYKWRWRVIDCKEPSVSRLLARLFRLSSVLLLQLWINYHLSAFKITDPQKSRLMNFRKQSLCKASLRSFKPLSVNFSHLFVNEYFHSMKITYNWKFRVMNCKELSPCRHWLW